MSAAKTRIATIGTWGHLADPISELICLPEVEFVAHARATAEDDAGVVRKLVLTDSLPWFEDYQQMLLEVRPDVVIVSTRIDRITPIAMDAANSGCHLICEKPLAMAHEDLQRLYDVVLAGGVQCAAMLGNGRHPVMRAAAGVIGSGGIGEIALVNARKSYRWGNRPEWFAKRSTYGGSIPWVAIHALEIIHLLTGKQFVSVAAMQSNFAHPDRPECEDNGVLLLQLSGGGHASVSFDLLRPASAATHGDDWFRVVGSGGIIEAAMDRGWCKFTSAHNAEIDLPLPARGTFYADYVQAICGGGEIAARLTRRSFMLTHAALCARDAADEGRIVVIPQTFA